jgi:hypothetical protein
LALLKEIKEFAGIGVKELIKQICAGNENLPIISDIMKKHLSQGYQQSKGSMTQVAKPFKH